MSFQNYPGLVLFRELDLPKCVEKSRISERTSHGLRFLKFPVVYSLSMKSMYVIILGGKCAENENQM